MCYDSVVRTLLPIGGIGKSRKDTLYKNNYYSLSKPEALTYPRRKAAISYSGMDTLLFTLDTLVLHLLFGLMDAYLYCKQFGVQDQIQSDSASDPAFKLYGIWMSDSVQSR